MRRNAFHYIFISCLTISMLLSGCSPEAKDAADPAADAPAAEQPPADAYEDYIRSALENVDRGTLEQAPSDDKDAGSGTTKEPEGRNISTDRTAPIDFDVSSMEGPAVANDPFAKDHAYDPDEDDVSPSPSLDPNATPTPEPTPYITPEEFDVGKCCIYINGESDSALGTEVVTAINKVRKDLGYKELVSNKSLATCADRRTRETVARFDHVRPNGQMFYSLAPEHFKAEMIIRSRQKGEEIVDSLIKNDAVSRGLIFTERYQSVGASSFKCNGDQYTVVSFGL